MTQNTATHIPEVKGGQGIAILSLTRGGSKLGESLAAGLDNAAHYPCKGRLKETLDSLWPNCQGFVCIMACGIVVRAIARHLAGKHSDPAVVVCDEQGQFAISLLSGHLGGANALAREVAAILNGQAVITTASDVLGHTALDCWARDMGLTVSDPARFTRIMGRLVDRGHVTLYSDWPLPDLPGDLRPVDDPLTADLCLSDRLIPDGGLLLAPGTLSIGLGCNRGTPASELAAALEEALAHHGLSRLAISTLASTAAKRNETGLLELARSWKLPLVFFSNGELNGVDGVTPSPAALQAIGVQAVAEPAALLAAGGGSLIVPKMKWPNVTIAIARNTRNLPADIRETSKPDRTGSFTRTRNERTP